MLIVEYIVNSIYYKFVIKLIMVFRKIDFFFLYDLGLFLIVF